MLNSHKVINHVNKYRSSPQENQKFYDTCCSTSTIRLCRSVNPVGRLFKVSDMRGWVIIHMG